MILISICTDKLFWIKFAFGAKEFLNWNLEVHVRYSLWTSVMMRSHVTRDALNLAYQTTSVPLGTLFVWYAFAKALFRAISIC